jgi:hypothetical protein
MNWAYDGLGQMALDKRFWRRRKPVAGLVTLAFPAPTSQPAVHPNR